MSDINMTDNWRSDVNITPINSLYQKLYSINCIKTKNPYSYSPPIKMY